MKVAVRTLPILEITSLRGFGAFLLYLLGTYHFQVRPFFGELQYFPYLAARGIVGVLTQILSSYGVKFLPIGTNTALFMTFPVTTVIMCWAVLREPLNWQMGGGVLLAMFGAVVVAQPPGIIGGHVEWTHERLFGVAAVISATFLVGINITMIKAFPKSINSWTWSLWQGGVITLGSAAPLVVGGGSSVVLPTWMEWAFLAGMVVTSAIAQVLPTRGFQVTHAATANALAYLQVGGGAAGAAWCFVAAAACAGE